MIDLAKPGTLETIMAGLAGTRAYQGMRVEGNVVVTADGRELSPRPSLAVRNHSPCGFEWGYGGSGPAQLALAILLQERVPKELAERLYQDFKWKFVASWDAEHWELQGAKLRAWIQHRLEIGRAAHWQIFTEGDEENA